MPAVLARALTYLIRRLLTSARFPLRRQPIRAYLRRYAEARGTRRVEGKVTHVARNSAAGDLARLRSPAGSTWMVSSSSIARAFGARLIEGEFESGYDDWTRSLRWIARHNALRIAAADRSVPRATAAGGLRWRSTAAPQREWLRVQQPIHQRGRGSSTMLANLDGEALAEPWTLAS